MMKWMQPPVLYPRMPDKAEAFGDDSLPGKGRVAMQQQRQHALMLLQVVAVLTCVARTLAEHDRVDRFEMRLGLGTSDICTLFPSNSRSVEVPRWYLTSPDPPTSSGLDAPPSNSLENRAIGFGHDVREDVQAARDAPCRSPFPRRRRWPPHLIIASSAGTIGFAAIEPEPLGADIFAAQEGSPTPPLRSPC